MGGEKYCTYYCFFSFLCCKSWTLRCLVGYVGVGDGILSFSVVGVLCRCFILIPLFSSIFSSPDSPLSQLSYVSFVIILASRYTLMTWMLFGTHLHTVCILFYFFKLEIRPPTLFICTLDYLIFSVSALRSEKNAANFGFWECARCLMKSTKIRLSSCPRSYKLSATLVRLYIRPSRVYYLFTLYLSIHLFLSLCLLCCLSEFLH